MFLFRNLIRKPPEHRIKQKPHEAARRWTGVVSAEREMWLSNPPAEEESRYLAPSNSRACIVTRVSPVPPRAVLKEGGTYKLTSVMNIRSLSPSEEKNLGYTLSRSLHYWPA